MSYDARHPDAVSVNATVPAGAPRLMTTRLPPELLAKVGETYAVALSALHQRLSALEPLPSTRQAALDAALAEIARLEHLGVQLQAMARVLDNEGSAMVERIDLAAAARQALAERAEAARRRGVTCVGPREPLEVEANAGVVEQLLGHALDYALQIGTHIEVDAARQGQPAQPMLTLNVRRPPPTAAPEGSGSGGDFDELHWQLFAQLARAVGLAPQRVAVASTVVLMLGFGPADAAAPATAARSAAELPHTPLAVGRRVLVLDPRELPRLQAHRLMHGAGMSVDAAATIEQARAGARHAPPDLLVTGFSAEDPACAELIEELRAAQPRLRVIELVDDDSAFALSVPGSDRPARVGRQDLARTLLPAVSQELDAAWPQA